MIRQSARKIDVCLHGAKEIIFGEISYDGFFKDNGMW